MYTSYIGQKFLGIYNERMHTSLSAEEFFEQIFFQLFFNDEKHLMHVSNSPFFQKPREEDVKKYGSKPLAQYHNLRKAIEQDEPNMAIYVGYAAKDIGGTTSGQISEMSLSIDANEMYASWIGEALAIGLNGGYLLLIDEPDLLWHLFQGWEYYRKYLNQTPHVKDKQIETWNGHWLYHWCDNFDERDPQRGLYINLSETVGRLAIPTCSWLEVIMSLAKKYRHKTIMAYAYSLSQTNTTLGFINLYLSEIYSMYDLRDKLILDGEHTILTDQEIESYATFYNFKSACQLGCIGIKAIEPDKLRQYFPVGTVTYAQGKEFQFKSKKSKEYELYKIWIIAMINKTELLDSATELAKALLEFESTAEKGKTVYSNLSKEVRKASRFEVFGDKIKEVMINAPGNKEEVFKKAFTDAYYLPRDIFPLFIVLLDFEYNYWKLKD